MKGFIEVHDAEHTFLINVNYIKVVVTNGPESIIVVDNEGIQVKECYGKVVQLMQEAV